MNGLANSIMADDATRYALAFMALLVLVVIGTVAYLGRRTAELAAKLSSRIVGILEGKNPQEVGGTEKLLIRALRDHVAFVDRNPLRFVTQGLDDERIEAASESMLEHGAATWLLRIGEHLTAIALTITFTLLGLVLTQDVTDAIRSNAGEGAASMRNDALIHAFAKMGGKFFISAVGLVGAVAFRWSRDAAVKRVTRAIQALLEANRASFVSLERHRYERAVSDREALHLAIAQNSDRVAEALHSMRSIDVSVKDMGAEVGAHLGKLMKESIADEFAKNLAELRVTVESLAARVERTLTDALTGQVENVLRALEGVRATVHERAGGEVEVLLDKMKDLLSGGFQSAQGDMANQMGGLSQQLAALVTQVSEASQRVSGDASARTEEMRAQMETLLIRTNEVVDAMQTAQQTVAASSANSAAYVRTEVAEAVANTKAAASELDQQSRRVEGALERILADLEKALKQSAEVVAQFTSQAAGVKELSRTTWDSAKQFALGGASIQQAAMKFDENLKALHQSIEDQRASQQEFARVIPESVRKVQERLTEQTRELSSAWGTLQTALSASVKTIGTSLSEPIENLGDHVEALNRAVGALPGAGGVRK